MSCNTDNTYPLGSAVLCEFEFRDPDTGALVDPSNVFAAIKDPNGTTTTYQYGVGSDLQKTSTGLYWISVTASMSGTWYYRGYSSGTYRGASEESFEVEASEFG